MLTRPEDEPAGLYGMAEGQDPVGIPLKGVRVQAKAHDFVAEVQVIQCYQNNTTSTMECVYHFPLDDQAAVCGFQAEYEDGTIVKGKVKEKNQAATEYNEAIQQGKQANLLKQVKPDIFTINVGNLPSGGYVKIVLTYVTTLQAREDAMAFVLPTCIAPRYTPANSDLSPEEAAAVHADTAGFEPLLGLAVDAEFTCKSPIKSLQSPTHSNEEGIHFQVEGNTGTFQLRNVPLDRDLVVLCQEEKAHQPRVSVERGPDGRIVGMVSIFPEIEFRDQKREFIFLLDRSGSMQSRYGQQGEKSQIDQAKDALLLFLRALPVGSTFNVVGFGSRFESMFDAPRPYNDEALQYASGKVASMGADLGGTQIHSPLQNIFQKPPAPGVGREVFVLTDGQVSNNAQVFDLIRQHCSSGAPSRLFCVGVGANVSRHLCNGMARSGRGTVRFVEDGSSAVVLQSKLMGQLKQALQPRLDDVTVKWELPVAMVVETAAKPKDDMPEASPVKTLLGYRSPNADDVLLKPREKTLSKKPRIYPSVGQTVVNKERLLSYAIFPENTEMPTKVTISCWTEDGVLETTLPVTENDIFEGLIAHKLAARKAIQEYEDREHKQQNIISRADALDMALTNSLASQLTSFIAISENPDHGVQQKELTPLAAAPQPHARPKRHMACRSQGMVYRSHARGRALQEDVETLSAKSSLCISSSVALKSSGAALKTNGSSKSGFSSLQSFKSKKSAGRVEGAGFFDMGKSLFGGTACPPLSMGIGQKMHKKQEKSKSRSRRRELNLKRVPGDSDDVRSSRHGNMSHSDLGASGDFGHDSFQRDAQSVPGHTGRSTRISDEDYNATSPSKSKSAGPFDMCVLQKANGSFELTDKLIAVIGDPVLNGRHVFRTNVTSLKTHFCGISNVQDAFATLLAVAAMQSLFREHESIWELNANKAQGFLKSLGLSDSEIQKHLSMMVNCIRSGSYPGQTDKAGSA